VGTKIKGRENIRQQNDNPREEYYAVGRDQEKNTGKGGGGSKTGRALGAKQDATYLSNWNGQVEQRPVRSSCV